LAEAIVLNGAGVSADSALQLASTLGELFEPTDRFVKAAILENALSLKPADSEARFQLAYLYGEIELPSLSMDQYLKVPAVSRTAWAWNNLGVAFGNVGLKGKAVAAYQRAEDAGVSLAKSNRARLLCDAGFLDEAEKIVRDGLQATDADSALGETLSSISNQREEEEKKLEAVREAARKFETEIRLFGAAFLRPSAESWNGLWKCPRYSLRITVDRGQLSGLGSFSRPGGIGAFGLKGDGKSESVTVRLDASPFACAAFGTLEQQVEGSISSLLSSMSPAKVYLSLDPSGNKIRLMELKGGVSFSVQEFERDS
jgi:tetratricopeptide (TPR) repeat protein